MTQIRDTRFHALDTSALQNRRAANVVRPGVYKGYRLRANSAAPNRIDLTHGNDNTSILVTAEGVRVQETEEQNALFLIDNADPNLTRIDLAVAEYTFTTDNDVEQQYKIVRGRFQPDLTTDPVYPTPAANQIPLAYIVVRPQLAFSGIATANVATDDILHVPKAATTLAPDNIGSLMPIIEPSDSRRIYVHPGILPSFDGSAKIDFDGGYSAIIDPATLTEGQSRYYLFGISDDNLVVLIGNAATEAGLPELTRDVFPVCIARAQRIENQVRMQTLTDLRFPFARRLSPTFEEETYKTALADSVFQHVRVERFQNLNLIDANSLLPVADDDVEMSVDRSDTSLVFEYSGEANEPNSDITVSTTNLLAGTAIGRIEHFMLVADSNIAGLKLTFSTSSSVSGFINAEFGANQIVRIPAGGSSQLFVRFIVPKEAFRVSKILKIFSYGCFMKLNPDTINANVIGDVGLNELKFSIPNLIANGNFRFWGRDDINGNTTDPDDPSIIQYQISEERPYAADGWQVTDWNFPAKDGVVSRQGLSNDVIGAGIANANDTALVWVGAPAAASDPPDALNQMEYRVQVPPGSAGNRVTFAINYRVSSTPVISVGVALYELTPQKTLRRQGTVSRVAASVVNGSLLTVSDLEINEATHSVGFIVFLQQTTGDSQAVLWNARAAIGSFRVLPYTEPVNAREILRKYYERGQVFVSQSVLEGERLGISAQFGSVKFTGFGTLIGQVVDESDSNRSLNVGEQTFSVTSNSLVVTASSVSNGQARIDLDWEAFVKYSAAT